jgi:hypothetical protein
MVYVMTGGKSCNLAGSAANVLQDGTQSTNPNPFTWVNTSTVSLASNAGYWTIICVSDGTFWYIN